ncbi:tetratricopeptide repeat protein, partial [bacterium]|nr:tetratricopeptide repeat protein [bacterium]
DKYKTWLVIVLLGLMSVISYSNMMRNDFVWDDNVFIKKNFFIKDFSNIAKVFSVDFWEASARSQKATFYRPLIIASLIIDYAVWQDNPFGYHLTNLIFHMFTTIFLFFIACIFLSRKGSFLVALIFAVHPIHTESVTFILGRTDVFSAFFLFATVKLFFYAHLGKTKNLFKSPLYWLSVLSYLFSLFCKEASIIAMPILILIWFVFLRKIPLKKFCLSLIPFAVATLIYMLIRFLVYYGSTQYFHLPAGGTKIFTYLTMAKVFIVYIGKLLIPIRQSIDYKPEIITSALSPVFIISLITLLTILISALYAYKSGKKIFSFSVFWFLITIMPVSNIISIGILMADRFLYVPSFAVSLLVGGTFEYFFVNFNDTLKKRACFILFLFIILCLTTLTVRRNYDWKSSFRFWWKTAKTTPVSYRAHGSLGLIYMNKGYMKRAVYHSERALLYNPKDPRVLGNIAVLYMKLQQIDKAIAYLDQAIEQDSRDFRSYANLFAIYEHLDKPQKALYNIDKAIELSPGNSELYIMKTLFLRDKNKTDEAILTLKKLLNRSPDDINGLFLLANIYVNEKYNISVAKRIYEKILNIQPNNKRAKDLLGKCLALKNRPNKK